MRADETRGGRQGALVAVGRVVQNRSLVVVFSRRTLLAGLATFPLVALERVARAATPTAELMGRLAAYATRLERLGHRVGCTVEGSLETLDGEGGVSSSQIGKARVDVNGDAVNVFVVSYTKDGRDETGEAREKMLEKAREKKKPSQKRPWRLPIAVSEQPRYAFETLDRDPHDAGRVRLRFTPVARDERTIEGTAWVDERTGELLSAGFKVCDLPALVDYVNVSVEFGQRTPFGTAVSKISVDGKGGLLFVRKHFRASVAFSDYRLGP